MTARPTFDLADVFRRHGQSYERTMSGAAGSEWLAARQAELPPVPYFHVVFSLPPPAAEVAFQSKQTVYGLLMRAAADALMTLAGTLWPPGSA